MFGKKRGGEPDANLDVRVIETESLVTVADIRPWLLDAEGCVALGEADWDGLQIVVGPEAFATIDHHTRSDTTREVGGFLIGRPLEWQGRRYLEITSAMAGKILSSSAVHVTISSDTWARAREQVHQAPGDDYIVGWYHTHPNMPVFMSQQDRVVHESFFRESWQVALVVEPSSREANFFAWVEGRIRKVTGYRVAFPADTSADERWRPAKQQDLLARTVKDFEALTETLGWWHNRWIPGERLCLRVSQYAMNTLSSWLTEKRGPRLGLCRGLKVRQRGLEGYDAIAVDIHKIETLVDAALSDPPTEEELKRIDVGVMNALRKRGFLTIVGWVWLGAGSPPLLAQAEEGRWPELQVMLYDDGSDGVCWRWRSMLGKRSIGDLVKLVPITALSEPRMSETLAQVRQAFVEFRGG